jgi:hypothetical protein
MIQKIALAMRILLRQKTNLIKVEISAEHIADIKRAYKALLHEGDFTDSYQLAMARLQMQTAQNKAYYQLYLSPAQIHKIQYLIDDYCMYILELERLLPATFQHFVQNEFRNFDTIKRNLR